MSKHGPLRKPKWWACQHPERQPDGNDTYDSACDPCYLALIASGNLIYLAAAADYRLDQGLWVIHPSRAAEEQP